MSQTKVGEPLIIDQNTFEIKGKDSGKVYGKGENIQDALAKQTQIGTGGTPTVGGRPDLYATTPTEADKTQPFVDTASGKTITPTVATPAQLAQNAAGTLPSFNVAQGIKPPETTKTETVQFENYTDLIKAATKEGAGDAKSTMLGAPDDYDNQILRQKSALFTKLYGKDLTPDDLKWLTPAQSQAILSNDNKLIEAQIAGLNTITQGRKEMKKEAEESKKQEERDALTRISTLGELGLFGSLSDDALAQLSDKTGLDLEALKGLRDSANETGGIDWELDTDLDGNLVMFRFDPKTGAYESKIIQKKTVKATGGGTKESDDTKRIREFQKRAAEYIKAIDAPGTESTVDWGTAWDSLHAEFPEASSETIDAVLGGRFNPETNQYEGRAATPNK